MSLLKLISPSLRTCLPRTAAHVLATGSLRASEPLGEFGALKVEWGCWGVGPERNGNGHELVVLGVPSAFSRGDSVQERHFAWRVPDPPVALEEEREEEGPLRLEVTPDIIPGFKSACTLVPGPCVAIAMPLMLTFRTITTPSVRPFIHTQPVCRRWSCARAGP